MKKCNICSIEKDCVEFTKDKRRNDGRSSYCKECMKIKSLEYYHRTKESRKETINQNRKK